MIYCISDIHGCFDEFEELLNRVGFSDQDQLYILGDLVDRGPNVDKCVEWVGEHRANEVGSNVHFICSGGKTPTSGTAKPVQVGDESPLNDKFDMMKT